MKLTLLLIPLLFLSSCSIESRNAIPTTLKETPVTSHTSALLEDNTPIITKTTLQNTHSGSTEITNKMKTLSGNIITTGSGFVVEKSNEEAFMFSLRGLPDEQGKRIEKKIFTSDGLIHFQDACTLENGKYNKVFDVSATTDPYITNFIKDGSTLYFVVNSDLKDKNYPSNFSTASIWNYNCSTANYTELSPKNLFDLVQNGTYVITDKKDDDIYFGLDRDTMSVFQVGHINVKTGNIIQVLQ